MRNALKGYERGADGLYRRRFWMSDRKRPRVMVRRPDGTLLRTEKINPDPEPKRI